MVISGEMAMLVIYLCGLLPSCIKGWVDTVKNQICIPVSHQFKFVSHRINMSHFRNDSIGHLT